MRLLIILSALACAAGMARYLPLGLAALAVLTVLALKAERDSLRDPLTGLQNLRALDRRRGKYRRLGVTVVYLDVNDLKRRNDTQGHAAGDDALRRVAEILRHLPGDAYRVGGDEFLIVTTAPFAWTPPADLPVSLGTSQGPGRELDALIRRAEAEMDKNKG